VSKRPGKPEENGKEIVRSSFVSVSVVKCKDNGRYSSGFVACPSQWKRIEAVQTHRTITGLPAIVENSALRKSTKLKSIQDTIHTQSRATGLQKFLLQPRSHPSTWQNVLTDNHQIWTVPVNTWTDQHKITRYLLRFHPLEKARACKRHSHRAQSKTKHVGRVRLVRV